MPVFVLQGFLLSFNCSIQLNLVSIATHLLHCVTYLHEMYCLLNELWMTLKSTSLLQTMAESIALSSLDLKSAFWNLEIISSSCTTTNQSKE